MSAGQTGDKRPVCWMLKNAHLAFLRLKKPKLQKKHLAINELAAAAGVEMEEEDVWEVLAG